MVTFSSKVKDEICKSFPKNYKKALSEIIGIMMSRAEFNYNDINDVDFSISTENINVIKYIEKIFLSKFNRYSLNVCIGECIIKNSYNLKVSGRNLYKFLLDIGLIKLSRIDLSLYNNFDIIDFKSFVKGVFISCGSITNPKKWYHLEFILQNSDFSLYFKKLLDYRGLSSKIIKRRYYYVVYIKEADKICEFLGILGANNCILEFENIRVNKEYSNNKNRVKNCIGANEDKLIIASVKQVRNIMFIDDKIGLDQLSDKLREIAKLRLENKEMSLKDLGMLVTPPLGKSGVLHRLRKIEQIAKDLEVK